MSKISRSPDRHTFQKENYIKRCKEKGETPSESYLDYFEKIIEDHDTKFVDPKSRENNMEYDLLTTDWILEKVRASEAYAQNLYAAMCNNDFIPIEVIPILRQDPEKDYWSASWRYAGGIVADMRQEGDYIDWYCSGIRGDGESANPEYEKFVGEGCITDEIRNDLQRLGWVVAPGGDWENFN
jgi:hypothetical protein